MSDPIGASRARAGTARQPGVASGWPGLSGTEDRIFTQRRLLIYGCSLVGGWVFIIAWFLTHGWHSNDFQWIWLSGKFAVSDPARLFDLSAFSLAEITRWFGPPEVYIPAHAFAYPPTLLFFLYPLGFMPYWVAFAVWAVATLALYAAAVYAIIPRPTAAIVAIAPVTVAVNFLFGHNGFLTAGLIGLSLAFLDRRPWLAGVFIGLLTYKPHFGLLFPLALLASRNWRALGSAAAATIIFATLATIAFGIHGWQAFIDSLLYYNSGLSTTDLVILKHQSVYGLLHWVGANASISWSVHLAAACVLTLAVGILWAKPLPHSLKAALLCVASVSITPYVLGYDLCILSIAVAFLVADGMARGFLPGERTAMVVCFISLFLLLSPIASVGPFVCATLLVLIARRVQACLGGPRSELSSIAGGGGACRANDSAVHGSA